MKRAKANEGYVVTSGELLSLFAANNIAKAVARFSRRQVRCGGLVPNINADGHELEMIERLGELIAVETLPPIHRSVILQQAELAEQTVQEFAPESTVAMEISALADQIERQSPEAGTIPKPLSRDEFSRFTREFVR